MGLNRSGPSGQDTRSFACAHVAAKSFDVPAALLAFGGPALGLMLVAISVWLL